MIRITNYLLPTKLFFYSEAFSTKCYQLSSDVAIVTDWLDVNKCSGNGIGFDRGSCFF